MIVRFLFAGGISFLTNMSVLYLLTQLFDVWYLAASVISFCVSIAVSFVVQKYWTFKDFSKNQIVQQSIRYTAVCLFNLLLNTVTIYLLVDVAGIWYMLAAGAASILVAISGFVLYRRFVFTGGPLSPLPSLEFQTKSQDFQRDA